MDLSQILFDVVVNSANVFISILFSPLNLLLDNFINSLDFALMSTNFYAVLNQYVVPLAAFFVELVPPLTWQVILLHFTITIGLYTIAITMHVILKPLKVIKKVIPFT